MKDLHFIPSSIGYSSVDWKSNRTTRYIKSPEMEGYGFIPRRRQKQGPGLVIRVLLEYTRTEVSESSF